MPTLLTPPPPPSLRTELPDVSFFGRTFEEYTRFFALDAGALRRTAVLDVAAGPSSFTAEAIRQGIDAVAVDPLYSRTTAELSALARTDYRRMFAQMRAKPQLFRLKSFPSFAAAEADRKLAAQRFLADYDNNLRHGRYVRAALPALPFLDQGFSLVLCAHLLFTYADRFDYAWHLAACRELVRVTTGEVRIHPVCGAAGRPYAQLDQLRADLAAAGIRSDIVPVDYEFFRGSNSLLVLRRDRALRRLVAT
ncbi:MAG: methyltransferase [Lacunisphaera sp.]|nr:methyltransferase [Lacunisphaera sp.]